MRPAFADVLAACTAALAACTAPAPPGVPPSAPHGNPCLRSGRPCVDMYVVAHEDDDLLFMNPDIARSIAAGNRVVIVHLTTGDLPATSVAGFPEQPDQPDFTSYWVDRERGILNAFTAMALGNDAAFTSYQPAGIVPQGWTGGVIDVAGVKMPEYDLVAASGQSVSAVYLRLSDFQLQAAWNDRPGAGGQHGGVALPEGATITDACDDPDICPLGTAIPAQQLTRDQLVDALVALIVRFDADSVSAQDATTPMKGDAPSGLYWDLLGTPDFRDSFAGFTDYWDHVYGAGFVLAAVSRAQPSLAHGLAARLYRDYTLSQEPINLGDAEALAKAQVFGYYAVFDASIIRHGKQLDFAQPTFGGDYDLGARGSWQHRQLATRTLAGEVPLHGRLAVGGSCVGVDAAAPVLGPCEGAPVWQLTPTHQLQASGTTSCLAANDDGTVALAPCSPQIAATTLLLFGNGQLRSPEARCLAAADTTLTSVECTRESTSTHATGRVPAEQDFTLRFDPPRQLALASQASAVWIVRGQACTRNAVEVVCAPFAGDHLGPAVPLATPADADDVQVMWDPAAGAPAVCTRAHGQVACGARTSSEHSDDRVLRFADLGGRGVLDLCGRTARGIACSLDTGGAWAAAEPWTTMFADSAGWSDPAHGDTLQLGDVDGDGLVDACGRSANGIACTPQLQGAFADAAQWSFDEDRASDLVHIAPDFSDVDPDEPWAGAEALYGSFRLVDINHDGLADACGRGTAGIWCAFSTGSAFERKKLVAPGAFGDGAPIAWGDLDGDTRTDVCSVDGATLTCIAGY
jgi:hypothetical protein